MLLAFGVLIPAASALEAHALTRQRIERPRRALACNSGADRTIMPGIARDAFLLTSHDRDGCVGAEARRAPDQCKGRTDQHRGDQSTRLLLVSCVGYV